MARDAQRLVERLGAPVYVPPPDTADDLVQKYGVTPEQAAGGSPDVRWLLAGGDARLFPACDRLPIGVEAFPGPEHDDLVLWVESHRAVVAGDTLVDFGRASGSPIGCGATSRARRSPRPCGRCSICRSSSCSRRTALRQTEPRSPTPSPETVATEDRRAPARGSEPSAVAIRSVRARRRRAPTDSSS